MKPIEYWNSLEIESSPKGIGKHQSKQAGYAKRSGSSFDYVNKHIFKKSGRSRNPRSKLIVGLVSESEGNISLDEAIDYFLVQPIKKLAKEMEAEKIPSQSSAASLPSANAEVPA